MYDPDHDIDLLDIGQYAHMELQAVGIEGYPALDNTTRTLRVAQTTGDFTATVHVGETDELFIAANATRNLPFSLVLYEVNILY